MSSRHYVWKCVDLKALDEDCHNADCEEMGRRDQISEFPEATEENESRRPHRSGRHVDASEP